MQHLRKKAPTSNAGFPLLTSKDLHECIVALGIAATIEDISKPTPTSTRAIFASLIEVLMGISLSGMDGPKNQLLGMMEYRELYPEALEWIMFYRHCHSLATLCQVNDFNMNDLVRPEPARLRFVLSGIMNFAKFREERLAFHQGLVLKLHAEESRQEELRLRLNEMEDKIAAIHAKEEEERPLVEKTEAENAALAEELGQLSKDQQKLSSEVEALKAERLELSRQLANHNAEFQAVQGQIASAKARLVRSPDRIKRAISEMSMQVATERATLAMYQSRCRNHEARLNLIAGLEADVKRLVELSRDIASTRSQVDEKRRDVAVLNAKIETLKSRKLTAEQRGGNLDRQLQLTEERIIRHREIAHDELERSKAKLAKLKEQNKLANIESEKQRHEIVGLEKQIKELDEEMQAYVKTRSQQINELARECHFVKTGIANYVNVISSRLQLQPPATPF